MEGLFNPLSILLHVVNAAILFAAVYILLYKPVRKFMAAREDRVAGMLSDASEQRAQAERAAQDGMRLVAGAKAEAESALTENRERLKEQEKRILDRARADAEAILVQARSEAEVILNDARDQMRAQATDLAVEIARNILGREVRREDHEQLIDETIRKVG